MKNLKVRLALMNFLEFAVWGAYLTCMGRYLGNIGIGTEIGYFYSMQGVVSIFMPAIIGIVAGTENAWNMSSCGSCIHDSHGMVWSYCRGRCGFRHHLLALFHIGGILHANTGIVQFCGIYGIAQGGNGHCEGLPANKSVRYGWFHLYHVVC